MKRLDKIGMFCTAEYKKFITNSKLMISTFLVPIITILFIVYGITYIEETEEEYVIAVYFENKENQKTLEGYLKEYDNVVSYVGSLDVSKLESGEETVAIQIGDRVELFYDSSVLANNNAFYQAKQIADKMNIAAFDRKLWKACEEKTPAIEKIDISSKVEQVRKTFMPLLVLISIIGVMLMNMNVITLAADSISGEKERGSFDSLRLSGIPMYIVVLGKWIFIGSIAFLTLLIECIAAVLAIGFFNPNLGVQLTACVQGRWDWILPIMVAAAEMALVVASIYVALCSFFNKAKHATNYASIGMVIISMSISLPVIVREEMVSYLPVANFLEMILSAIHGNINMKAVGFGSVVSLVISMVMLGVAAAVLEREEN